MNIDDFPGAVSFVATFPVRSNMWHRPSYRVVFGCGAEGVYRVGYGGGVWTESLGPIRWQRDGHAYEATIAHVGVMYPNEARDILSDATGDELCEMMTRLPTDGDLMLVAVNRVVFGEGSR